MNKYITSSILMAAGLGSVNASAITTITAMKGSDTLFDLTTAAINATPSAVGNLTYVGTGSGNGESAMIPASGAALQTIAPMSSFMDNKVCGTQGISAPNADGTPHTYTQAQVESQACGLVIGLDAVSVYSSNLTGGQASCNGNPATGTSDPTTGLDQAGRTITWTAGNSPTYGAATPTKSAKFHAYNGGQATLATWASALRIIYFGLGDTGVADCESDVRNGLVQNWGNIFQAGGASCGSSNCTVLRHAWRRDSESGTTETFLSLLGAPKVTKNGTIATDDPFCSGWQKTSNGTLDPNMNDYPPGYRDRDPIRTVCAGANEDAGGGQPTVEATEQVCDRDSKLGLVMTINAVDFLTNDKAFPTALCTSKTIFGAIPPSTNIGSSSPTGICPNGDKPLTGIGCLIPATAALDPNCLPTKSAKPGFINSTLQTDGLSAGAADGRVYGLHSYFKTSGGTAGYNVDKSSTKGRPITGMFTRIHTTRSMNADPTANVCQFGDATTQIGCLTQADQCSIGYAGKSAALARPINPTAGTAAVSMLVNGIVPSDDNIRNSFYYPLSRKLYYNSLIGFNSVWGAENALAAYVASPAGSTLVDTWNFTTLAGGAFLEDFNEQLVCGAATNTNGCTNNPITGVPTNPFGITTVTTCGDKIVDPYEDCDNGTGTGGNTATCPTTSGVTTICNLACRTQYCFNP